MEQTATIVCVVVLATLVCIARVRLVYHTRTQVFAGFAVGTACGFAWFALVARVSPWLFASIASSPIAHSLFLRDTSSIPDLIVFQHRHCQLPQ